LYPCRKKAINRPHILNFGKKKKQIQNVKFCRKRSLESESVMDGNSSAHAAAGCFQCLFFEQLEQ